MRLVHGRRVSERDMILVAGWSWCWRGTRSHEDYRSHHEKSFTWGHAYACTREKKGASKYKPIRRKGKDCSGACNWLGSDVLYLSVVAYTRRAQ
uniref:Uncharacterized protein n=1 Tax=Arundo donax TaxID=35708 RepID=A0A0A8YMF3_ARUDO